MGKVLISVSQKDRLQGQLSYLKLIGSVDNIFIEENACKIVIKDGFFNEIFTIKKKLFHFFWLKSILFNKLNKLGVFDLIIINSDRTLNLDLLLCQYSEARQIKLVIPYLAISAKEGLVGIRKKNLKKYKVNNFLKFFLYSLINNNLIKDSNITYCFYPLKNIIKIFYWKIKITNSWILGHNYSPEIHVDSNYTKLFFLSQGINPDIIKVRESIFFNKLVRLKNKKIRYDICFSYTPYHEHKLISKKESTNIQLHFLNLIKSKGFKVVIALHPKCDINFYKKLFYDFEIVIGNTENCIIQSNLFISFYSSTLLWAVFSNKPFLILDPFNFNYKYYNELIKKNNSIVKTEKDLITKINRCLKKKQNLEKFSNKFLGFNINNYNQILN